MVSYNTSGACMYCATCVSTLSPPTVHIKEVQKISSRYSLIRYSNLQQLQLFRQERAHNVYSPGLVVITIRCQIMFASQLITTLKFCFSTEHKKSRGVKRKMQERYYQHRCTTNFSDKWTDFHSVEQNQHKPFTSTLLSIESRNTSLPHPYQHRLLHPPLHL